MESNPLPGANPAWFTDFFVSLRELERRDAVDLGLCPTGAGSFIINPISEHPNSPDSQLSRFDDLFTILSLILHQLSNRTPHDDTSLWKALFEAMESLSDKLLGFESLFKMLVGLDCPTVRAASCGLLAWIKVTNNENMLRIFAETVLQQHSAAWFYQTHRLHGPLLVLAARFGFSTICEELIKNGVSPNQTAVFPDESPYSFQPTALVEAAKMGNVDTAKILLDCGADVNLASHDYGSITAGKLLSELKRDSLYRHQRLEILRLLLERGLDINAPCWGHLETPHWAIGYTTTILDHVVLDGDEDVAAIFSISCADAGRVPRVSLGNIISHARMGSHELKNYLSNAAASAQGSISLIQAERTALRWAMERGNTKVVLALVLAGVDIGELISYDDRKPTDHQNYLEEVFRNAPISPASSQLAFALVDSDQRTGVEEALIKACLGSPHDSVIKFILSDFLGLETAKNGAILLACAARLGQFTAVQMILQRCPGVLEEKTEFWNSHCPALFMSAATFPPQRPRLLNTPRPASAKMLDFLLQQGADINACHPRFWRSQHWISGEQLAWLVDNLARFESLEGISVYRMIFPRIQEWENNGDIPFHVDMPFGIDISGTEKAAEMAAVGKLFRQFAVPIFSLSESELLQGRYYFETWQNPLSFFILLKPGNDFISSVINAGVDINGAGSCPGTDTPLRAAVKMNDLSLVKLLVSQGAKITKTESSYYFTTLQLAAGAPLRLFRSHLSSEADGTIDPRIAEFLLQQGADPNGRAMMCCVSPLQIAEDPLIVQHLLDNGANPREVVRRCSGCKSSLDEWHFGSLSFWDRRHIKDMGILHFAVLRFLRTPTNASKRAVELLVSRGADIDKRLFDVHIHPKEIALLAFTALEVATGALQRVNPVVYLHGFRRRQHPGNIAMVELLLSHKAQVNPPSTYSGPSALAIACDMQDLQMVRVLLRHGASPNPHILESPPPLSVAAATGNLGLIIMLLCAGADMGVSTLTKHPIGSPITAAARQGRLDTVSLLLNFEQPPEILGKAVGLAFRKGFIEVTECIRRHMEQKGLEDPAAAERVRAGMGEVSEDNREYRGLWGDGYYFGNDG